MEKIFEIHLVKRIKFNNTYGYEIEGRALDKISVGQLVSFNKDNFHQVVSIQIYGKNSNEIEPSMGGKIVIVKPNMKEGEEDFLSLYR